MRYLLLLIGILLPVSVSAQIAITEVRWAGSALSTADEWLRIENISGQEVDLSGWSITTRKSSGEEVEMVRFTSQTLSAGEMFLISNYPQSRSALEEEPNLVTSAVSLPNTKLLLRVLDPDGSAIDTVDDGVGAPFAGGKDPHRSMIRIDVNSSGNDGSNWRTEGEVTSDKSSSSQMNEEKDANDAEDAKESSESSVSSASSASSQKPNPSHFSVTRITPRPSSGKRTDQEVTIRYTGGSTVVLDGWKIDNREGGARPVPLDGIEFRPNQTQSFSASWLGISFTPEADSVRLLDDKDNVISAIQWAESEIGIALLPERPPEKLLPVQVLDVSDPRNVRVTFTEESLNGMLPNVERYWSRIHHKYHRPSIGITLSKVSKDDLPKAGEMIYLDPLEVTWNSPPHITANLYDEDGKKIASQTQDEVATSCTPPQDPELQITAIYPSPEEGEDEWIEIQNMSDSAVDLCGLFLDDITDGGSKPWEISKSTIIQGGASRKFFGADTGIRLNNTGDSVTILGEDDEVIGQREYGSTKKGELVRTSPGVRTEVRETEQKISSITDALPVKYVNVREENPPQIAAEQSVESDLIALYNQKNQAAKPIKHSEPSSNASVAWVLVFAQSVGFIVLSARRFV